MPHLPREHSGTARFGLLGCVFLAGAAFLFAQTEPQNRVTAVRFWTMPEVTRIAVETDGQFEILSDHLSNPERVFFDLVGTHPVIGPKNMTVISVGDKLVEQIRVAEPRKNITRVVLDLQGPADVTTSRLENPHRLIIEVWRTGHARPSLEPPATAPAPVTASAPKTAEPPATAVTVLAEPVRVLRTFHPPVRAAARPKQAQVALLDPPALQTYAAPSGALYGKLTTDYASLNPGAYRRVVDLKHLPNPSEPEIGSRAYPTPHTDQKIAEVPKAETAEVTGNRVTGPAASFEAKPLESKPLETKASQTKIPEARLAANHDEESGDKPAVPNRATASTASDSALPAKRNTTGDRSMIRVLGLKVGRIVLDAGHGGHDTGTVGPEGLREKDLVLDVTRRLGALIEDRMGSEVIYTRTDDTFIPLERRTEIANEAKADIFLSIHANSSPVRTAAGVETYYLSFTTSKTALDLAARENAASNETVYDLRDILQKIALNDKVDESRDFASRVQTALFALSAKNNKASKDRGIRKAPFVVLIGANMPSVLAEIGFISNAHDESTMKRAEYRERIAEALYKGVSGYAGTLSHFQVAQRRPASSE